MVNIPKETAQALLRDLRKMVLWPQVSSSGKPWRTCLLCGGTKTGKDVLKHMPSCQGPEYIKRLEAALNQEGNK